ncbi:ribonuclease R [Salinisphaera orenii]|uniref:ribonuclease R n=1 Tax=Salinisphaera orenii TaxID=856731 RepID=UPI000DBE101A
MTELRNSRPDAWWQRDPDYDKECANYSAPVPSRRLIAADLAAHEAEIDREALVDGYALGDPDRIDALDHRVRAMLRDGELESDSEGMIRPVQRKTRIRGRVQAHRGGFGFVIPDDADTEDVFLPPPQMRGVMADDRVDVRLKSEQQNGRRVGRVLHVVERARDTFVGYLQPEQAGWQLQTADSASNGGPILVADADRNGADEHKIVVVRMTQPPNKRAPARGEVVEILGDRLEPSAEIERAIRAHDITDRFPDAVDSEAAAWGDTVSETDKRDRVDLRDLPLVTIDGADAKDFDDAVHARPTDKGWQLWVAIADVAHYVSAGSALDAEAAERGTSAYFPGRVVPMLPEALSNGLCSLRPEVDRLALVCEMQIDRRGQIQSGRWREAVIRSHARLTYDQVTDWLEQPENRPSEYDGVAQPLADLRAVYEVLAEARHERGAIAFETTDPHFIFGPEGRIESIVAAERGVAHLIIEECMIAANVATARELAEQKLPTLYRVHGGPTADGLADLRSFLTERGLSLPRNRQPVAADFDQVLAKARERDDAHLIQTVMLQSLSRAYYAPDNGGHFGLALDHYLHFTSPIRRYPDLLVHRGIKHLLAGKPLGHFAYDHAAMVEQGEVASAAEKRADDAAREVDDWLKCEYMRESVDEIFDGVVANVASFGLFVELDDVYATGMVHISELGDDYFVYDADRRRLVGRDGGTVFGLCDRVSVRVVHVDVDARKIELALVAAPASQRSRRKRAKTKSKS